jgi:hypothetical protein
MNSVTIAVAVYSIRSLQNHYYRGLKGSALDHIGLETCTHILDIWTFYCKKAWASMGLLGLAWASLG